MPKEIDSDIPKPSNVADPRTRSVLLAVVDSCMLATKSKKHIARRDACKVRSHIEALQAAIRNHQDCVAKLNNETASKELELVEV